jgi:hypothetical protein
MHRLILLSATLLALGTAPTLAQEAECYQNETYLVIEQARVDEVGSDFLVRPAATGKIACTFAPEADDIRIGAIGDPLHFAGLAGSYLVLERSTGPDGDVVIYDLEAGATEPVIDVQADSTLEISDERVVYWERVEPGTAENCPSFAENSSYFFGSVIAAETVFDVATGTATRTGETHCSSTQ